MQLARGVQFTIGQSEANQTYVIQVNFQKTSWNKESAEAWLKQRGLQTSSFSEGTDWLLFPQMSGTFKDLKTFTYDSEEFRTFCCGGMIDSPAMPMPPPMLETGEAMFHVHMFQTTAAFTDVPKGMYKGHRHPVERNAAGMVTGFADAEGHTHPLPAWMVESGELYVEETLARSFKIEQRGKEWCAVSEDGTRSMGCYPTEAEAKERLRQVEAAKVFYNPDQPRHPAGDDSGGEFAPGSGGGGKGGRKGSSKGWPGVELRGHDASNSALQSSEWVSGRASLADQQGNLKASSEFLKAKAKYDRAVVHFDADRNIQGHRDAQIGFKHELRGEKFLEKTDKAGKRKFVEEDAGDSINYDLGWMEFMEDDMSGMSDEELQDEMDSMQSRMDDLAEEMKKADKAMMPGLEDEMAKLRKAMDKAQMEKKSRPGMAKMSDKKKKDDDEDDDDVIDYDLGDVGQLYRVQDVEIFATGKWNGDEYSQQDLDDIVAAFNKVGFEVPIKLGHKERSGAPAFGWVESVKRNGNKLVATFKDLPKKLYDAVRSRRYDNVSSEIFWNLERDGVKHRRVLKAVALLGAETPGVSFLAPLRTVVNSVLPPTGGFDRVLVYTIPIEELDEMDPKELQAKVQKLQADLDAANAAKAEAENKAKGGDAKAVAQLTEAQATVKNLQQELKAATDQIAKLAADKDVEIAKLKEQMASQGATIAQMQENTRKELVKAKVEKVPSPRLRAFMQPLYEIATQETTKVVTFTEAKKDAKPSDIKLLDLLDQMTSFFRAEATKMFSEHAIADDLERADGTDPFEKKFSDPSAEVATRTKKYQEEHKVSYAAAAKAVLKADPELADEYAQYTSGISPRRSQ